MLPDETFYIYVLMSATDMVLLLWTTVLIAHTAFLGTNEARWLREGRRISLILVLVGLALAARWHIEHGHGAWLPEYFILSGIGFYLAAAIYSTYARLRRLHIRLASKTV